MEPQGNIYGEYIHDKIGYTAEELAEFRQEAEELKRQLEIERIAAKSDNVVCVDFRRD
jgi:membrane protein involved in colicin uptake